MLCPDPSNHTLKLGDIYKSIDEREVDRVVMDVPEPWHVVPWAAQALAMGGILLSFLPTILQVHQLVNSLAARLQVPADRDGRGAAEALERHAEECAAGPPHGGPFGIHHYGPQMCPQRRLMKQECSEGFFSNLLEKEGADGQAEHAGAPWGVRQDGYLDEAPVERGGRHAGLCS